MWKLQASLELSLLSQNGRSDSSHPPSKTQEIVQHEKPHAHFHFTTISTSVSTTHPRQFFSSGWLDSLKSKRSQPDFAICVTYLAVTNLSKLHHFDLTALRSFAFLTSDFHHGVHKVEIGPSIKPTALSSPCNRW